MDAGPAAQVGAREGRGSPVAADTCGEGGPLAQALLPHDAAVPARRGQAAPADGAAAASTAGLRATTGPSAERSPP